nr:unnamed protein product [Leishmania braziliensis]
MNYRSTFRAESPPYQQLYKMHSESTPRSPSSVTPKANNCSLTAVSGAQSTHSNSPWMPVTATSAHSKGGRADDMVYVADVNPTYSVPGAVRCIAPVNDRIMWTAEYSGTLCIRALPKATPLKELAGRKDSYCISLLYLPAEDVVWAGFQDGYLHVYSAKYMTLLKEVMAHNGGLNCMVEVEGAVFTGGANWKVSQWVPAEDNAQLQRILHGHSGAVRCLSVYNGPTGAVVFSGSDDGTVRAWDPYESPPGQQNSEANIHTFTGHSRAVLALAVVPHANQLWSAGEDMTVRVWDMRSLSCLTVCRGSHTAPVSNLMVVESRVWSADKHGHILVWDIATRSLLQDLAVRLPDWGRSQSMVLAMQKVQSITAYKVWTASSSGVMQCWNAETAPIIFDNMHVSAGVPKNPNAVLAAHQTITASNGHCETAVAATPASGNPADAVSNSALAMAPFSNDRDVYINRDRDSLPISAPLPRVEDYIRSLQEELEATKREAKLNYETYRMEAQCEIETQQLLAQENDHLRGLIRELERRADEPHEELGAPVQASHGAASYHLMNDELGRLQSVLIDTQAQLEEALERQRELEAELDQHKAASFSRQTSSISRLPSAADYVHGDSHYGSGPHSTVLGGAVNHSANVFSAILSTSGHSDGDSASVAGVPVERTRLSRRFKGGNWRYIMEEKPHELRSTFIADCCAGLGVAPTQLKRVDLSLGSLLAEVEVVHPASVPAAELERRMQTYRFPALMRLHTDAFTADKTVPDTAAATIKDLQRQLAMAQQQRPAESSPEPQHPNSNNNSGHSDSRLSTSEWQRLKDQNDTLRNTLQRQIKLISDLKNEMAEKDATLADIRVHLRDAEERLQEAQQQQQDKTLSDSRHLAHESSGTHTQDYRPEPPLVDNLLAPEMTAVAGRAQLLPTACAAGEDEDHEALKRYLQEQLKPMIACLKRARGELQFDNGNLRKRVEELTAQVQQQQQQLEAAHQKKAPTTLEAPAQSTIASQASEEEVQNLRDDHTALNNYLHEQLKPMISRLKREQGELQLDLLRARGDWQKACSMFDEAAAALKEECVREEKMGEAMEALQKALEAEQLKNQAANREAAAAGDWDETDAAIPATRRVFERRSGRPTQPARLCGSDSHIADSAAPCNDDTEKDSLDRLIALNLDLSVRLADAETVITQLQDSLACSSSQLAEQRSETQRLLGKIQQYQQSGVRPLDLDAVNRCASIDDIVSSASPSMSPSRNQL